MRSRSQAPPPSTCGVRVQLVGGAGHEEAALAVEALLHQGLEEVLEEAASILRRGERGKGEREVKGPGGEGAQRKEAPPQRKEAPGPSSACHRSPLPSPTLPTHPVPTLPPHTPHHTHHARLCCAVLVNELHSDASLERISQRC